MTLSSVPNMHLRNVQRYMNMLEDVGSEDPQVALLLLCQCGSFCKMVHLARSTPPSLTANV